MPRNGYPQTLNNLPSGRTQGKDALRIARFPAREGEAIQTFPLFVIRSSCQSAERASDVGDRLRSTNTVCHVKRGHIPIGTHDLQYFLLCWGEREECVCLCAAFGLHAGILREQSSGQIANWPHGRRITKGEYMTLSCAGRSPCLMSSLGAGVR